MKTKQTENIVCPHCGNEDDEYWSYDLNFDDINELQCISCSKIYHVKIWNPIYFTTAKKETGWN